MMRHSAMRSGMSLGAAVFAIVLAAGAALGATVESTGGWPGPQVRPRPLPEGKRGIAARYPGDVGIEKDAAVLFSEGFEETSVAEVEKRWTNASNKDGEVLSLSGEVPEGSVGRQSLEMTATRGKNAGGHLWKLLKPGVDVMYARLYVRFAEDHPYVHHLVKIGGWRDSPEWPQGEAGYRPEGTRSFQTGLEVGSQWGRNDPPGAWFMYTYWRDMKSYMGPQGKVFYGNAFLPKTPQQAPRGKWQCVEFMVKANSAPERHDGEQAFWIDGRLVGRWAPNMPLGRWVKDNFVEDENGIAFEGFRWRTVEDLKVNTFWLLYYMQGVFDDKAQFKVRPGVTVNPDVTRVWFDDIVVATEYIGPLRRPGEEIEPIERAAVESTSSEARVESTRREVRAEPERQKAKGPDLSIDATAAGDPDAPRSRVRR